VVELYCKVTIGYDPRRRAPRTEELAQQLFRHYKAGLALPRLNSAMRAALKHSIASRPAASIRAAAPSSSGEVRPRA
jgi:hypothetical protein